MRLPNTYTCAVVASALLTGAAAPAITPPRPAPLPPANHAQIVTPLNLRPLQSLSPNMVHMPKTYFVTGLHTMRGQTHFDGYSPGPVQIQVILVAKATGCLATHQRR